jgi:hypothetical protein
LARFWAIGALLTLILALGKNSPVFPFLFHHVPGFDLFQAPARWLAVTTVGLAALAGIGAQHWPRGHRARRRGATIATVGGALLIGGLAAPRLVDDLLATFGPATIRLGVGLTVSGALMLLRGRGRRAYDRDAGWWQAAVTIFIALDLLTIGSPLVPTVGRSLYRGDTKTAAALRGEEDQIRVYWPSDPTHQNRAYDAQYRVKFDYLTFDAFGARDATYWRGMREDQLPNAGMLDGIASVNNFDPLLVAEYVDMLEAAVEAPRVLNIMGVTHVASDRPRPAGKPTHVSTSAAFYWLPDTPGRAWIVPNAQPVASDGMLNAMKASSFNPSSTVLVERDPEESDRASLPHDPLANTSVALQDGPNRVTIDAILDDSGYLVLADTWYPGWRVTVNGKPAKLLRANHAFRAVRLTAGEHTVKMAYRPLSALIGGGTSLTVSALLVLGLLTSLRKK